MKYRIEITVLFSALLLVVYLCAVAVAADSNLPGSPVNNQEATATPPPSKLAQAVLDTNPQTPFELARSADLIAELGEPQIARGLLKKILDANPDQRQLLELADRFNVSMFVKMAGNRQLAPEAKQLADKITAAVVQERGSPQRIADLISQLGDSSPSVHRRAMAALQSTSSAAVEPLIRTLADPASSAQHDAVRATLAGMGSDATRPLVAIIESDDPALVAQAIRTLSQAGAENATVFLLSPYASPESPAAVRSAAAAALLKLVGAVPDRAQAARVLAREVRDYYQRRVGLDADENGMVEVWQWDAAKQRVVAKKYSAEEAAVVLAERLARETLSVAPGDKNVRTLRLATMLEKAALQAGIDNPLPTGSGTAAALAAEFGVDELQEVVRGSLSPGESNIHPAAATAALQILGRSGSAQKLLKTDSATPCILALAARCDDARERMAAVKAIADLKPNKSFAGSSYVIDALEFAASGGSQRRVMIAGPSTERSRYIAGYLTDLGYKVDTATTGSRTLFELARSPDYELVLIDIETDRPAADLLLQQLRHDWRLGGLPVGILAGDDQYDAAKHVARNDPLAEAFARPHDRESMAWQIEQLYALAGSRRVPLQIRKRQAVEALAILAQLAQDQKGVFNVARAQEAALHALQTADFGKEAAAVLAGIGTPASQRALVNLASLDTQPIELREVAANAFCSNVKQHGILLTTEEIRRQYDRYNQSENKDKSTQKILGRLLNCIEAPSKGN